MPQVRNYPYRAVCARALVVGILIPALGSAATVGPAEMQQKAEWVQRHLLGPDARLPFSFTLGGQPSETVLAGWQKATRSSRLDADRTQHVLTWVDRRSGLQVRCVAVEYARFPAVEWTVYCKNAGTGRAPLVENLQGIDVRFERPAAGEFVLRHWKGDTYAADLYQPLEARLGPNRTERFAPAGGRGSNGAFPYYHLLTPGGGVLLAVGWPGQWAATFARDADRGLRVTAGQERTRLTLEPGEEVRTPLIALLFWRGDDSVRAQNLWRQWMWTHNVPRTADGKLPPPLLFGNTSVQFNEMCDATEANQRQFLDRYQQERVKIDFWWMDAGWYPCDGQWPRTGTWEPDLKRFPGGLAAISAHARTQGVKTLVWFEPERVAGGTWLARQHPEWLLGGTLLNLGRPDARKWLTDHVDRLLREQAISLYRQDFNMDPLDFWRKNDAPDRQGMTENLHVQGYLAYWDALRQRHPNLIIDSCASGGRRNDLETMRRAIALHPTDYNYADLTAKQAFHYSLFQWLPSFGSNTVPIDTVDAYAYRSGHAANVVLGYDLRRKDLDYALLRTLADEWRRIVPCYEGDYYPLTAYNRDTAAWLAWQFHRPEQGDGVVEAFRRPGCAAAACTFRLHGLDPAARYDVTASDSEKAQRIIGKTLLEEGLRVEVRSRPGAAVVRYQKVR
ncbi:MAG: alpha-galactosidase [Gemmataceae bacterium]